MKILFLAPYPFDHAPSQRFRFEMMLPLLKERKIDYDFVPFLSDQGWRVLYQKGKAWQKLWAILTGFARRKLWMLKAVKYDLVFIHREVAPLGPPVFEWWLTKVLRKKIIFDFDDAIWLPNTSDENRIAAMLKWHGKTKSICLWAWKVTAGNDYLADFARQYCNQVIVLPTVVDTEVHTLRQAPSAARGFPTARQDDNLRQAPVAKGFPSARRGNTLRQAQSDTLGQAPSVAKGFPTARQEDRIVIGWTGSHSTLPYLQEIMPVLQELETYLEFCFLVIADKDPRLPLYNYQFIQWHRDSEIEDLKRMNIGVMPLPDNPWTQGKCGFKLIQYLALEIPAVASPVGVNNKVLQHSVSGYFAQNDDEWVTYLKRLLLDAPLRKKLGQEGRKYIEAHYSLGSQKEAFIGLFDN